LLLLIVAAVLAGCDAFGSKDDATTDEIFEEGRTPPGLISEVEYVPLSPFFRTGGDSAPLENPQDVYVGYDELIYVVDDRGLHVLDLAGRPASFLPLDDATSVIQDRRLHLYITARRDTTLSGQTWNLPVVYRYSGVSTGTPVLEDIIWHPFDDDSRRFNRPDPLPTDEEVAFTGVAVLANNAVYVSRRGPVNDPTSVILPHNTVMEFTPEGLNTQSILALSPTRPSLRSAINPTDVLTIIQPPQRASFTDAKDFFITQSPYPDGSAPSGMRDSLRFATLSIRAVETPDGIVYRPDTQRLQVSADPDAGAGFLYEEFKFENPVDLAFAADGTNYLYVLDAAKDSLFVFTNSGVEGVAPPPGATSNQPVPVSFGGQGDGAAQFSNPHGVTYFDRIVYVADTGNDRVSRFRLNTDFE
jgi:hypothetical protein